MISEHIYSPSITVSSTISSNTFLQKAEKIAASTGLKFEPLFEKCTSTSILCLTPDGLQLISKKPHSRKYRILLYVDFVKGKSGYRLKRDCTIKQPLAKAVGIKPGFRPVIIDATTGLGQDGFVLASLGCKVTLVERNPLLYSLLEDGLARAMKDNKTASIVSNNMTLHHADSILHLDETSKCYDTVYLDPMYPERNTSALGRETMRTIKSLVGDDGDAGELFHKASRTAKKRVTVKRPIRADSLTPGKPDHVITLKSSRYDIYFTRK